MSSAKRPPGRSRAHWATETRPRHASDTEDFYSRLGLDIKSVIGTLAPTDRVLDLGCGDGAMYTHLGFDRVRYTGVDFSTSMLARFKDQFPDVQLFEANALTFSEGAPYDLVFSCGLIQYFSGKELGRHLDHLRSLLSPQGRVVHTAVPWKRHRLLYRWGWALGARPPKPRSLRRLVRPVIAPVREAMGHWWGLFELDRLARKHGYTARFHASNQYIYRFHVVLSPSPDPERQSVSAHSAE